MSNSPRYVGKVSPPYLAKLVDDSGALISFQGYTPSVFTATAVNVANSALIKTWNGQFSFFTDTDSITKLQYNFLNEDLDTPGLWYIKLIMHRNEGDLEFDPDLMIVLPS